jgi:hypothetical protein
VDEAADVGLVGAGLGGAAAEISADAVAEVLAAAADRLVDRLQRAEGALEIWVASVSGIARADQRDRFRSFARRLELVTQMGNLSQACKTFGNRNSSAAGGSVRRVRIASRSTQHKNDRCD